MKYKTKEQNMKRNKMKLKKKNKLTYNNHKKFLTDDWKFKIKLFPKDIQRKLCIYTWRAYWREYVPLTGRPPSWLSYHNQVQKLLWEARQKNIHFLHLPFNTLPENKKWIMGCQCDTCKNDTEIDPIEKHMHSLTQYRNNNYFPDVVMPTETTSKWNEYLVPIGNNVNNGEIQCIKVYDPLCGSYKENKFTKGLRGGYKFQFSYPILNIQ